jgi:hypothetical protein
MQQFQLEYWVALKMNNIFIEIFIKKSLNP